MSALPLFAGSWRLHRGLVSLLWIAFVAIVTGEFVLATKVLAAEPAGQVQELRGEAFADAAQQHRDLVKDSPIYVGDRVSTGTASRLTMHLGADTTIQLGEKTELVIDKLLADAGGE